MNKPGLLLILLIPLAAWGLLRDIANTAKGGSIDLRNRVTGSRVAAQTENDPYSYKWMQGDPEKFCDIYNEPGGLLSKTTVTPWVLAAHAPFNNLNYRTTQWLWFFLQYGLLIGAFLLWYRQHESNTAKWGLILVLLYSITPSWRHHVDHGQIYIIYAALLLILFRLSGKESSRPMAIGEGILGALLIGSRPVCFTQFAEPFNRRSWWTFAGAAAGAAIVFIAPLLLFGKRIWNDYRLAMEAHSEIYLLQIKPQRVPISYPGTIEGIPIDVLGKFDRYIPFADTSIYKLISFQLPAKGLLILWALATAGALGYMIWKKATPLLIWWAATAWILIGDFVLPAFRHTYNDVLALPLILVGISVFHNRPELRYWLGASGLVLLLMFASWKLHGWFLPVPSMALWCLAAAAAVWSLLQTGRVKA